MCANRFFPMGLGAHSWFKLQQQSSLDTSSIEAASTAASNPKSGLVMEGPMV